MKYGYEAKCQNRIPSGVVNLHDLADGLEAGGETLYQLQLQGGVDGQSLPC